MKNDGHGNRETDGFDAREDAALWNLLGRAPAPQAGPFFARRVLRDATLDTAARSALAAAPWWQPASLWRAYRRLVFVAGAPLAALLLLFLGLRLNPVGRPAAPAQALPTASHEDAAQPAASSVTAADVPDDVSAQDVEVIADLDNLLKHEESRLWTEDDPPTARF